MSRHLRFALLTVAVLVLSGAPEADAQIRASEPATMMQTIDGTVITMDYYRPRTRGREPLFGHNSVVWEHVWTPGANWATTIEFQKNITLNGREIPAGKYSVWMEMDEAEYMPKTFILDPEVRIFHTMGPPERDTQIRMPSVLSEDHFVDVLTWQFEELRRDGGTLTMRWGTLKASFDIGVEPSMRETVTPEEAAPMVGSWEFDMMNLDGTWFPTMTLDIALNDDGTLHGDMENGPDPFFDMVIMQFLPYAEGIFAWGEVWEGEMREVWEDFFIEFDIDGGTYTSFTVRGEEDMVVGRGRRVQ
jgi:hypothetical protein